MIAGRSDACGRVNARAAAPAKQEISLDGTPGRTDVCPGSALSCDDLEQIVSLSGLGGGLSDPTRQSEFGFVEYSGRKYKVLAYPRAMPARRGVGLLGRTGRLFAPCLGRVDNCLVCEFVESSGQGAGPGMSEGIGNFLADLAGVAAVPMTAGDFEEWCRTLERTGIFLRGTARALGRYLTKALSMSLHWDLEYLDAVPKNFVFAEDGKLVCIDSKHLHPGPRGVSMVKLRANIGAYCRQEDYDAIRNAYRKRLPENRLEEPAYAEFLLLFYSLFFLVMNAAQFPWRVNVEKEMSRFRRKTVLGIIGVSPGIRLLENLRWDIASGMYRASRLPGRALHYCARIAGRGAGHGNR